MLHIHLALYGIEIEMQEPTLPAIDDERLIVGPVEQTLPQ